MAKKTVKPKPIGRLKQGLTWRLSDPGMGLLERAGLAALYMSLRAAEELGKKDDLAPLIWDESDLTPESVTLRSTADDKAALTKLFEWAWQVKDGVLYLPAVHRSEVDRDFYHRRLASHNGIFCTSLQHPNTQPRMDWEKRLVKLDENQEYDVSFQTPAERVDDLDRPINPKTKRPHKKKVATSRLRLLDDIEKLVDVNGCMQRKSITLSNWVYPGISGRFSGEASWFGSSELSILVMLAPIAYLFNQMHRERATWLAIIPDVRDLQDFDTGRRSASIFGDLRLTDVASLTDAGLRFLSIYQTHRTRRELQTGCRVVAMGKVGYYQSQSIRKGVVDIAADALVLRRYRLLDQHLGNRWMRRKVESESADTKSIKKSANAQEPVASGFVTLPTVRGRIADNLIARQQWYVSLSVPLPWDIGVLERQRKRRPGSCIERLWFNTLSFQRRALMELIREDEMWDVPAERDFVEAFWEILGALYFREKEAVERGGSRSWGDRIEDLNEDIRRSLNRAKTGPLLRETVAELFARPVEKYRSPHVRNKPGLMWKLIDRDWKRGRDLALLALASYQSKGKRAPSNSEETEVETSDA